MRYHVVLLALLITPTVHSGKPKPQQIGSRQITVIKPKKPSSVKVVWSAICYAVRAIRNQD